MTLPAFSAFSWHEIVCFKCGVPFCVPGHWQDSRREDKAEFFCPNGHAQAYVKSEADRLREQLAAKERELEHAKGQRVAAERRAGLEARRRAAAQGQLTRVKKRVQHGVCPCCNRTFQNVGRHMATKHPDWHDQEVGS